MEQDLEEKREALFLQAFRLRRNPFRNEVVSEAFRFPIFSTLVNKVYKIFGKSIPYNEPISEAFRFFFTCRQRVLRLCRLAR